MDLHQLYVFTKVVEQKSFSKAADSIYLSQSTVSSHIHSLEKTLNVPLFDRVGRETILTPHGERLYHWAQKMLRLKDEALHDLKDSVAELKGVIHIGVSSVPGQFIVPKLVKDFSKQYESVTFSIKQDASKIVSEKIQNGTLDVGFLGEKYENDILRYIPLLKEKLVLIASNEYKFEGPVSIAEMLNYPFVMRSSDSGTKAILEKFLKKNRVKESDLKIVSYTNSSQTLIELVKHGLGISIISEITAQKYAVNNQLQVYDITGFDDERYFYLVYNVKKTLPMISKLFIESVTAHSIKID
ncbi:selenium metabolism-associated LysR family transcriptional regulator [Bacillus dakarensis]|uniref:selenium metabolism-associated LysR family transcriptional regulator n=1 Tax=Robertmurraya dakarensis TaxID=1926278 RepID=UPI0009812E1F|nr:selenium metabolism-associated LysR family transcriptional regulator [Bacillus dakarensis]